LFCYSQTNNTQTYRQIKQAFPFGGSLVSFSKDEIQSLKISEPPGITIMGFKDISALKIYHNIRTSSFVYPDEQVRFETQKNKY
jgi:hypothetical protein